MNNKRYTFEFKIRIDRRRQLIAESVRNLNWRPCKSVNSPHPRVICAYRKTDYAYNSRRFCLFLYRAVSLPPIHETFNYTALGWLYAIVKVVNFDWSFQGKCWDRAVGEVCLFV